MSNRLAEIRSQLARRQREVEGLTYDLDFAQVPEIRTALQRNRRQVILIGGTSLLGMALFCGLLLPWYLTLFVLPTAAAAGWFVGLRMLERNERQLFDNHRKRLQSQVPGEFGVSRAACDAIQHLPEWIFNSPAGQEYGAQPEQPWKRRIRALVNEAATAFDSLSRVHRDGLLNEWVQREGSLSERAEQALVPLLKRATALARLYSSVDGGSQQARATADSLLAQMEQMSQAIQEAAALAMRCATAPQQNELRRLQQQMNHLEHAARMWQEAEADVD